MRPRPRADETASKQHLLDTYGAGIWALCRRLDPSGAEDAYQDVWSHLFERVHRFDPNGTASLKTWLHTLAHRKLIDRHRRRRARGEVIELPELPHPSDDPEGITQARRRRADLERALKRLPFDQRQVVLQHHLSGMSIAEIAELDNLSPGTVKSRLHRARARLAQLLEHRS